MNFASRQAALHLSQWELEKQDVNLTVGVVLRSWRANTFTRGLYSV